MIVIDCIQGEETWLNLKAGRPSASNIDKLITTSGKPSKQAKSYMYRLAGEKLLGAPTETFQSPAMARGIEMEEEARQVFEFVTDSKVEQVGLVFKDERKLFCVSPDGFISNREQGLEIKCPLLATHVSYLDKNKLPTEYIQQIQMNLFVSGLESWMFMSYYPGIKPLILRIERDEKLIEALGYELESFCIDLDELTERLRT